MIFFNSRSAIPPGISLALSLKNQLCISRAMLFAFPSEITSAYSLRDSFKIYLCILAEIAFKISSWNHYNLFLTFLGHNLIIFTGILKTIFWKFFNNFYETYFGYSIVSFSDSFSEISSDCFCEKFCKKSFVKLIKLKIDILILTFRTL